MNIEVKVLNSTRLTKLLIAASRWLSKYSDVLNDLNVYPVPDGDTGTNMSMTLQAVENELIKLNHEPDMEELADIVSEAILLGARGNSGTILSQIIQGFLEGVRTKEEVTVDDVKIAFRLAKEKAYKAVSEPVEGTMLTVIRRVAEEAEIYNGPSDDFIPFLVYLKEAAKEAVEETPNQLPKLKEAGVVDAGGQGIFYILEGFEKSITDPEMLHDLERIVQSQAKRKDIMEHSGNHVFEDIKFKYCTEFVIESGDFDLDDYKSKIVNFGDSMVCAQTSKKTKTHIHTNNPGAVLEIAGKLGNLSNIKIDNMEIQHKNMLLADAEQYKLDKKGKVLVQNENSKPIAYFAIVDNMELGNLFLDNGATAVLIGGQTQNPSVADIEEGINKIKADKIVILPNNKNIISSAKMAAERSSKEVTVLETKTMLEGEYVVKNKDFGMDEILKQLPFNTSIEITQAVRDTKVDELLISQGDYIALINGKIKLRAATLEEIIENTYKECVNSETLNIFACIGKGSTEEANKILKGIKSTVKYSDLVIGQENYPYYIYITNRNPELPEIAIVTDSTSDLTPDMIKGLDVDIIPLKIKLAGDTYYRDGVDISKGEFWKQLLKENIVPKTSQPSPAEFKELYEKLLEKGYKKIISIHISSKLSGTQQAARVARGMLNKEDDIAIVDSKVVTFALAHIVLEAAKMVKEGKSFDEIIEWIDETKSKMKVYFVVKELSYLEKGGRIGRASSVIGGFLKIKPVLKLENGEVCIEAKALGERGALSYMEKLIKNEKNSIIMYTGWGGTRSELEAADQLRSIAEKTKKLDYRGRMEIGATIASHTGPVYGMGILNKIR
ncbi:MULTISPECIES: DegV family EDD domain-containing protein [Cetobacterium]|uniref:DegV family EDD domain-containing protein n=1 Tax=Cetobacterium TaxID=180162 RepID=UPI00163BD596|nr:MULTISPECIES: DegV family EDD domain-containing protein [Cetobacterium]MBC2852835.1 DegV family EDD domain-containing protein [Cetobacterium sp. 2G large]MCQ9626214.1 DegV family EDD domain-containing protein [Cetobacterium somerae]